MNSIENEMFQALTLKYLKEIQECKTSLLIYFENSVGIGDHSNHLDDMNRLLEKMANADEKLKLLNENFNNYCKL